MDSARDGTRRPDGSELNSYRSESARSCARGWILNPNLRSPLCTALATARVYLRVALTLRRASKGLSLKAVDLRPVDGDASKGHV